MALVSYENSDSSEYEDDENEKDAIVILNKEKNNISNEINEAIPSSSSLGTEGKLFNLLPQPTNKKPAVIEEDDEFLHKKEYISDAVKPKAKITVPLLSDFKDVESSTPSVKSRPVNGKKCGLLSMLPQPKNGVTISSKSLVPQILTQKANNSNSKKNNPLPLHTKKSKLDPKPLINDYTDESDNDDVENDFFSINKPAEVIEPASTETEQECSAEISNSKKPFNIESYFKTDEHANELEQDDVSISSSNEYTEASSSYSEQSEQHSNDAILDEEAIMKLCGTRGKRKREEIQIVDVNQKEVLADAKEWLLKGLMDDTTKRVSVSKRKGHEPTSQQKRKHQITYLAYQAKANEAELQNQWANNRMSRRQTQSKYGF